MQNKVELVGYYGSDEIIALTAWTSTNRELTDKKRERIPEMVRSLWLDGHKTPFERGIVHFLVDTDIASHIHLIKHRHAGTNGESARYKELKEDKMYIPEDWKGLSVNRDSIFNENKELHWWLHLTENKDSDWYKLLEEYNNLGNNLYHQCLKDLTPILGRKRAKETARYFKTYSSQITTDVIMNMSCFANFLNLRTKDKSQNEIRDIGIEMFKLVEQIPNNPFEATLNAFKETNII